MTPPVILTLRAQAQRVAHGFDAAADVLARAGISDVGAGTASLSDWIDTPTLLLHVGTPEAVERVADIIARGSRDNGKNRECEARLQTVAGPVDVTFFAPLSAGVTR